MFANCFRRQIIGNIIVIVLLFTLCCAFYIKTLAPTVVWGDSAKVAIEAYLPTGTTLLSGSRPLFSFLSKFFIRLIPFGSIAYRVNLASAFFGSLTIIFLFSVILILTQSKISAFIGAISLAVSHTFWHLSVIADYHTLMALFIILIILSLIRWQKTMDNLFLCFAFFILALSFSINFFLIVLIPSLAYLIIVNNPKENIKIKGILLALLAFLLGLGGFVFFYWSLLAEKNIKDLFVFFFAVKEFVIFSPAYALRQILKYLPSLLYQFPFVAFFCGLWGAKKLYRDDKRSFLFLFIFFVTIIICGSFYFRQRHFYIYLFSYLIFAVWIGVGFKYIIERLTVGRLKKIFVISVYLILIVSLPPAIYYSFPNIVNAMKIDVVRARTIPYRDNNRYFLLPDKSGYYGAHIYASEAFHRAKNNAVIIADFTPYIVMQYLQVVENKRPDITLKYIMPACEIIDFVKENISYQPVYLADDDACYGVDALKQSFRIIPQGPIFELEGAS